MYRSDKSIVPKKLYVCYVCEVMTCQLSIAFFLEWKSVIFHVVYQGG